MRFFFFIISLSILSLVYGYVGWRLIAPLQLTVFGKTLTWTTLILLVLLTPLPIFLRSLGLKQSWADICAWLGYFSLGFFAMLFTLVVFRDLVWMVSAGVQKVYAFAGDFFAASHNPVESFDPERPNFLVNSVNIGIVVVAGILSAYGLFEALRQPAVVEVVVPIRNLPADLEGFRIVQITDIHVGPTIKHDYVQTVVDVANKLAPDILAFTGDLADGSVAALRDEVAPLAQLNARYAKYFVTGNHEYYSGAEAWIAEVERLGFTVLMNEHRIVKHGSSSMLVGGVADYGAGHFIHSHASSPKATMVNAPSSDFQLVLAHQPLSIFETARAGYDLQICGHTHGGQFFPWNFFVTLQQPYIAGLHKYEDTWIYVSRGTGYWGPPLRLGARSEITVIKLTSAHV